jgi:molybdate transport system substrate-binding protein
MISSLMLTLAFAAAPNDVVLVAAASDLQGAFGEIGKAFEADGHGKVLFTFAASGVLTKQLKEGAPFDLFAAANASFVDDAVNAGACDGSSKALYARGHLVVWSKKNRKLAPPQALAELADARFVHIAIANPATAPYGVAAKEALAAAGLWDNVSPRVVLGENVRQTLQLAETGNADVAIVARSLAVASKSGGVWFDVDEKLHEPIEQTLAVCTRGKNATGGAAFARYVLSPKGKDILQRSGLSAP